MGIVVFADCESGLCKVASAQAAEILMGAHLPVCPIGLRIFRPPSRNRG